MPCAGHEVVGHRQAGKAPTGTEPAGAAVLCCPQPRSDQQIKKGLAPTPSFLTAPESVQLHDTAATRAVCRWRD